MTDDQLLVVELEAIRNDPLHVDENSMDKCCILRTKFFKNRSKFLS